jgi:hypothetical protein
MEQVTRRNAVRFDDLDHRQGELGRTATQGAPQLEPRPEASAKFQVLAEIAGQPQIPGAVLISTPAEAD